MSSVPFTGVLRFLTRALDIERSETPKELSLSVSPTIDVGAYGMADYEHVQISTGASAAAGFLSLFTNDINTASIIHVLHFEHTGGAAALDMRLSMRRAIGNAGVEFSVAAVPSGGGYVRWKDIHPAGTLFVPPQYELGVYHPGTGAAEQLYCLYVRQTFPAGLRP